MYSDAPDGSKQATSPRSTVEGSQTSAGIDERNTKLVGIATGSASAAPKNNRKKDLKDDRNVTSSTSGENENRLDDSKPVLFLSIDVTTNDARAYSVDVGMNDLKTMANLRESYNDMRSSFLWDRKRPVGVKFYQVSQISTTDFHFELIPRSSEASCTNQNVPTTYSYTETRNDTPLKMTTNMIGSFEMSGRRAICIRTMRHGTTSAIQAIAVVPRR